MNKYCNQCGKEVTFRDSFFFEGKELCGDCFRQLEAKPIMPATSTRIASPTAYLWLLYGGFALLLTGVFVGVENQEGGQALLSFGALLFVAALIVLYVLLYQIWRFLIVESGSLGLHPSIDTPGKAIGFLFIPIYNMYWMFQLFGKLPKDFNEIARVRGRTQQLSEGLGLAIPILILISLVPVVGVLAACVNLLILQPIFVTQAVKECRTLAGASIVRAATA